MEAEETEEIDNPLESLEGTQSYQHLDFRLLIPVTVKE